MYINNKIAARTGHNNLLGFDEIMLNMDRKNSSNKMQSDIIKIKRNIFLIIMLL